MGFSSEWEEQYSSNHHMSIWPWSDLVSYVYRYTAVAKRPKVKVLELGCGAGANIPLFKYLNADYYAIDGSETIIEMLQEKYPMYAEKMIVGDFTKEIPFDESFDVIVDRGSLTCNTTVDIKNAIDLSEGHLSTGGGFVGVDWYSKNHDAFLLGSNIVDDNNTKYMGDVNDSIAGIGNMHFSDENHLRELFANFDIKIMEEKIINTFFPVKHKFASWNFVAVKKD